MTSRFIAPLCAIATAAVLSGPVSALTVSQFVIFGDSNVDIGRLASDPVPGDGMVPPPNTVGGRSSNGPIIPEFLVERTGVGQLNFSFGGATSGTDNVVTGNPDMIPTGLLSQVSEYEALVGPGGADPGALYLLWAGSNDLLFIDKSSQAANEAAVAGVKSNLTDAVDRLAALGAMNIVIATRATRPILSDSAEPWALPDLDLLTPGLQNPELNDASGNYLNAMIRDLVSELDTAMAAQISLFDSDMVIRDIIANAEALGFLPYDGSEAGYCINNIDCSRLINYDGAHKTSAAHALIAEAFIEQFDLPTVPAPVPLPAAGWLLGAGGLTLFVLRRRPSGAVTPC